MDAEEQASCVLWYADCVVVLVVVILHSQMSLIVNLTLTKNQDEYRTDPERTKEEGEF